MSGGREVAQVEMPHVEKGLGATVGPQLLLAVRQNPGSEQPARSCLRPGLPPVAAGGGEASGPRRSWGSQAPRAKQVVGSRGVWRPLKAELTGLAGGRNIRCKRKRS